MPELLQLISYVLILLVGIFLFLFLIRIFHILIKLEDMIDRLDRRLHDSDTNQVTPQPPKKTKR